ncbi:Enzymatic polyprotein [Cucumis melo var. makuwa]|uniref:Enzymatic polyprotein n=1 Tax=Cucumis melo var. makuwa TaxID=1194695 RepID=A0A5D3BN76_CUCMM|nr:Enzymatic polyprotein [Cucumis melo var. makuwa]
MISKLLSKLSPHSPSIVDTTSSSSPSSKTPRSRDDLSKALAEHNSVEAHLAQVENRLKNWSIPKIDPSQVYKINTFNFSQQDVIVIPEENVAMKDEFTAINLLPEETLFKVKNKFKYLHIGCVQVALKPLFREGFDVPVYLALRDKRHLRFTPSLLGIVQSNLEKGPVYFNCKPGLTVSLQDKNIMDTLSLDVHSQRLELKDGSLPFAVSYRIYFKLMHTNISPKALGVSPKGYTMLMEVNMEKSSMTIPRTLKWADLTKDPIWKLQGETTPVRRNSTEASITEFPNRNVEVQFNSETSYPRISEIMSSRPSTSSIARSESSFPDTLRRSESIRASMDFSRSIPTVHYKKEDESLSPTQSDMERRTEPVYNQINVISSNEDNDRFQEYYSKYLDMWLAAPAETRKPFLPMPDFIAGLKQKEKAKNEALVKRLEADGQVAMIKGSTVWVTAKGKEIASNYPPEGEAYFAHPIIPAIKMVSSPYKTIDENKVQKVGVREIKNIQHQLNYTNKALSTLSKAPNSFNIDRLKDDASDYLAEINKHLAAIFINKDPKVPIAPIESNKISTNRVENLRGINMIKKDSLSQASTSKVLPVAQWVHMKNHYPQPSPPDLGWDDLHHEKHTYDGFTGNLRSWWHNQLTEQDRYRILTATRRVSKQKTPLPLSRLKNQIWSITAVARRSIFLLRSRTHLSLWWYPSPSPSSVVSQLQRSVVAAAPLFPISSRAHATSHRRASPPLAVRRIEAEPVVKLLQAAKRRCRRVPEDPSLVVDSLSVDSIKGHNQVSGKGFPTTVPRIRTGNVVRVQREADRRGARRTREGHMDASVATNSVTKQIDWAELTYGDISATIQAICINLCTENKHTTKVIKDFDYRKELGTFCKQYSLSQGPKEEKKKKKKSSSKRLFSRSKAKDPEFPRRKRKYYNKGKRHYPSKTNNVCFKCNRKGHYANRCPLKDKINALTMDEEMRQSILYAIRSYNGTSSKTDSSTEEEGINILNDEGSSSEDAFYSQSDSSNDEGAIPCTRKCASKCSGHINVITKDQETPFDLIEQLPDEDSKRTCLLKLRQRETKKPIQVEDLHLEVKVLKREVADNKQRLTHLEQAFQAIQEIQIKKEAPEASSTNPDRHSKGKALLIEEPSETGSINYISRIQNKKWMSKIVFKVKDFQLEALALIDSRADQNVIQEGLVPSRYFEKTKESLSGANGNPLNIQFKLSKVHICKGDVCLINTFILVKNLNEGIILGTPFLTQSYPFHVTDEEITSRKFEKEITFEFTHLVTPKYISNIEEEIHQFINRITMKEKKIEFLQYEVKTERVAVQINQPATQRRIKDFQSKLEKEVCSSIPNAFWDRKRHMVEKERGVPRLVINYKPLNKVLKWIRFIEKTATRRSSMFHLDNINGIIVDQHFKHLRVFLNIIKSNGLVVSQPKIKLFQTKIRFLGYEINQGIIKPIQRSLEFVNKFPDVIQDKTQLQRFLGCVNYIGDFIRDLRSICLPLYDRLKKNLKPWMDEHTRAVQSIKSLAKSIPCLSLVDEQAKLVIDTDASEIGYGGILKQELNGKISIVRYHSGVWNSAQKNYSIVRKEVLAIVLCVQKFQEDLINKEFLIRTDSKASKFIFQKRCQKPYLKEDLC